MPSDPKETICLITTGGTMEKVYSERSGFVENVDAKIDRYLKMLRLPFADIEIVSLMNKDSLEMTNEDRECIYMVVRQKLLRPAPVVITHGTDTLVQTGLYLKERLGLPNAPVLMTGAMTPLGFEKSDGLQNLTESLFAARIVPPGIYVVMHNQVFPIDRVEKDKENSRFIWK